MLRVNFEGCVARTKLDRLLSRAFEIWRQGKNYQWEVKFRLGDVIPKWVSNTGRGLLWFLKSNEDITEASLTAATMVCRSDLIELGRKEFINKIVKEAFNDACRQPIKPIYQVLWTDGDELIKATAKLSLYRLQNPMRPRVVDKTWFDIANVIYDTKPTTVQIYKRGSVGNPAVFDRIVRRLTA